LRTKSPFTPTLLALLVIAPVSAVADWTALPPGPNARIVYVSASLGSDANDGLSEATPKATIAAGFALLRNGHGDHLLLKRRDDFTVTGTLMWNKSGASAQEPMVFGTYGEGSRPIFDSSGWETLHISPGFQSPNTVRHLAIVGLHFRAGQRDFNRRGFDIAAVPNTGVGIKLVGVQTTAPQIVEDLLIEDCKFEYLPQGMALEGPYADSVQDVRVRRNIIVDTYATSGDTNGLYVSNVRGLLMEENVIDGVQRAPGLDPVRVASSLAHAVYVQSTARDVTLRNNIFARAFDGGMMRPGGVYEGNLVAEANIGTHQGYMYSASSQVLTDGIETRVAGNAFLKVGANQGINVGNIRQGAIEDNVLLSGPTTGGNAFWLIGLTGLGQVGLHDLVIADNYVLGLRGFTAYGPSISNVTVRNNELRSANREVADFHDYESGDFWFGGNAYLSQTNANRWFWVNGNAAYSVAGWTGFIGESGATTASFVDPATAPDIEGYQATIGDVPTLGAFLAKARARSRLIWCEHYTAAAVIGYLRQQLGLPPL
jgi:hypothetical protein